MDHVQRVKFPHDVFPECRWSRKGFMRTRWLFNDRQLLDLVNIHLFHDASNLVAMEATPSPYAQNRQKALEFTLRKLSEPLKTDPEVLGECKKFFNGIQQEEQKQLLGYDDLVPLFIFGDFNFRLDTRKVIEKISKGASPKIKRCATSNEVLQFVYNIVDELDSSNETHQSELESSTNVESLTETTSSSNISKAASITTKTENETELNIDHQNDTNDDSSSSYPEDTRFQEAGDCEKSHNTTPNVMTIGKKLFDFDALDETFRATQNTKWLQEMDNELDSFRSKLFEFKISFSPSYPFKEDTSGAHSYMKTRCPSWCDRILFNVAGSKVIHSSSKEQQQHKEEEKEYINQGANSGGSKTSEEEEVDESKAKTESVCSKDGSIINVIKRVELLENNNDIQYKLLGNTSPMGDHKPVLLYCQLSI